MHVALIGLSGTGKSTVAPLLAAALQRPLLDTDGLVVAIIGEPIAAFFARVGEAAFRDHEQRALATALAHPQPAVIATGGGIVLREANRSALHAQAQVVWLDAPDALLLERLQRSSEARPLLAADAAARLAAQRAARAPLYAALATVTINVSALTPAEVVAAIVQALAVGRSHE